MTVARFHVVRPNEDGELRAQDGTLLAPSRQTAWIR